MSISGRYILTGVLPVAPTPFHENGDIDVEGQKRVLDCLIDQGSDAICVLANYSEQFVLTDGERARLVDLCLRHVAGRVPVIVTCSHFSTRIAAERAAYAAAAGAQMLMMMPPYHGATLRASESATLEHFARVVEAAQLPIIIQDAPLSGVPMSVPFLVDLARRIPLCAYFKIEVPFAAAKLRQLIESGGDAIAGPYDGEESITLLADLEAGATGTMCSGLLPDLIKPVVAHFAAGRRQDAIDQYSRILPLINHENKQCGLRATKTIMQVGKVIASDAVRHPLDALHASTRAQLIELAMPLAPLSMRWGH